MVQVLGEGELWIHFLILSHILERKRRVSDRICMSDVKGEREKERSMVFVHTPFYEIFKR